MTNWMCQVLILFELLPDPWVELQPLKLQCNGSFWFHAFEGLESKQPRGELRDLNKYDSVYVPACSPPWEWIICCVLNLIFFFFFYFLKNLIIDMKAESSHLNCRQWISFLIRTRTVSLWTFSKEGGRTWQVKCLQTWNHSLMFFSGYVIYFI